MGVTAVKEKQGLKREAARTEDLEVDQRLDEGIGLKGPFYGPLDAGTKLKVNYWTEDVDFKQHRERFREVEIKHNEIFVYDCGGVRGPNSHDGGMPPV